MTILFEFMFDGLMPLQMYPGWQIVNANPYVFYPQHFYIQILPELSASQYMALLTISLLLSPVHNVDLVHVLVGFRNPPRFYLQHLELQLLP